MKSINNKFTKFDLIEGLMLAVFFAALTLQMYVDAAFGLWVALYGIMIIALPIWYVVSLNRYSLKPAEGYDKVSFCMFIWSVAYKVMTLLCCALCFFQEGVWPDVAQYLKVLVMIAGVLNVLYFLVTLCKKAYKESVVAVVYGLFTQLLPSLALLPYFG